MRPPVLVLVSIALVAAAVAGGVSSAQSRRETPPRKVLFVGDSFTYAQGGLDNHFTKLAASASPPVVVSAARAVAGGRPPCPLCGEPLDPQGHLCPRRNGYVH